ncbi:MAG: Flp pilus assembly protein CpaB [Chloroflexota bacterium]
MQGRGRFFVILGVVLLALAIVGGLLIVVLQGRGGISTPAKQTAEAPQAQATEEAPEMREVVQAVQNLGVGEEIRPDAVDIRQVEADAVPEGAFKSIEDVRGKLARQDIYQGDVLVDEMVIAVDDVQLLGWRATFIIPDGRVAVAFPVSQLSSVNYAIQPGDRVDVLVSGAFIDVDVETQIKAPIIYEGDESCQAGCQPVGEQVQRTFTQLTIDDAQVLGIGTWGQPTPEPAEGETEQETVEGETATTQQGPLPTAYDSLILIVTPQDAAALKFLRENGFVIDLALRSGKDTGLHETEQVTLEYVMTRFRISPPTKLPYRLEAMEERSVISTAPAQVDQ